MEIFQISRAKAGNLQEGKSNSMRFAVVVWLCKLNRIYDDLIAINILEWTGGSD